jgi:F-type H+-transporting ATPase subunit epsilon
MKTFALRLQDAAQAQTITGVTSFIGEDTSGSFGILAGHTRMMTTLIIGLARFRTSERAWQYLALPGGVLYFNNNVLTLSTRHFMLDDDYMRISAALQEKLLAEEENLHAIKTSLHRMEEELLKRLWEIGRKGTG